MKNKFYSPLMLLTIIIISFPSICFSKMPIIDPFENSLLRTVDGEYCDVYLGNLKNKKALEEFRQTVRTKSIENGLDKLTIPQNPQNTLDLFDTLDFFVTDKCISHVISNYLEKVVVVSHTENGRKICDKVKITLDPEVIDKYLSEDICRIRPIDIRWAWAIDDVLTRKF
ncbi:MAG: hypothetical protein Q7J31_02230, partial [Syntrophales bacterium]|nr:hypothetical protein [Syntrophales bacterium]